MRGHFVFLKYSFIKKKTKVEKPKKVAEFTDGYLLSIMISSISEFENNVYFLKRLNQSQILLQETTKKELKITSKKENKSTKKY